MSASRFVALRRSSRHLLLPLTTAIIVMAVALATAISESAHGGTPDAALTATLPDWSGQWEFADGQPDATGGMAQSLDEMLKAVAGWGPPPPLKPEIKAFIDQSEAQYAEQRKQIAAHGFPSIPQLRAQCTWGMPTLMIFSPLMFEIIPNPKETVMIFSGRETRQVYTDGRHHTPAEDRWPTYWGDSVGHWNGQTLLIDTIDVHSPLAFPDDATMPPPVRGAAPIFAFGGTANDGTLISLASTQARFIERIRMVDHEHLENRITVVDPTMLTAPWNIRRVYRRVQHLHRMVHEDCEGEDRNPVVDGRYTLAPPPSSMPPPAPSPPATPAKPDVPK